MIFIKYKEVLGMKTAHYPCGCSITRFMENDAVYSVFHCQRH